ncbi:MAG: hypothetical protein JNK82_14180 [Myxococcaceae bacterium]|nr:hypothetical protein [Myxococcaceae bacterium]
MTPVWLALYVSVAAAPLEEARADYQAGALEPARKKLEALLYPLALQSEADEREGHVLLSATYLALSDGGRAEEEALKALAISVEPRPDPAVFPPDFIAFFGPLASRRAGRIAALHAARTPKVVEREVAPPPTPPPAVVREPPAERPSRAWALAPFGVAQLKLGAPQRGVVWAIVHGVLAVAAGAGLLGALSLRGSDGLYAPVDAGAARALNGVWVAGGWLFAAAWAGSIIDGLVTSAD